jgi:8-oxo-dGTP pyrophosphatase MutT (NUDIX family)
MSDLLNQLAKRLASPLPGDAIRERYAPQPCPWVVKESPSNKPRRAAVLLLLYQNDGHWHLPLTLRPSHMAEHAGQVSLPGGAVEPGETETEAAVREFHEELGDDGQPIRMLGSLSPIHVRTSNYWVTPCVAAIAQRPAFAPNPTEVEKLIEVRLSHLLDPEQFGSHPRKYRGEPYTAPHFLVESHRVWGATCLILGELVTLLEEFRAKEGFQLENL